MTTRQAKPGSSTGGSFKAKQESPTPVTRTANGDQLSNATASVPGSKRRRSYQRNLAKARKGIEAGEVQPSVRPVAAFCGCGTKTAQSIIAELVGDGFLNRDTRGRVEFVAVA